MKSVSRAGVFLGCAESSSVGLQGSMGFGGGVFCFGLAMEPAHQIAEYGSRWDSLRRSFMKALSVYRQGWCSAIHHTHSISLDRSIQLTTYAQPFKKPHFQSDSNQCLVAINSSSPNPFFPRHLHNRLVDPSGCLAQSSPPVRSRRHEFPTRFIL